jgi:hypothetical protein
MPRNTDDFAVKNKVKIFKEESRHISGKRNLSNLSSKRTFREVNIIQPPSLSQENNEKVKIKFSSTEVYYQAEIYTPLALLYQKIIEK